MRTPTIAATLLAAGLLTGPTVEAATLYNFNVLYSGSGVATLGAGDDPNATNLLDGDSFNWRISAEGSEFWRVDTTGGFFPFMAFATEESGSRTGDFVLSLLLNGSEVFSASEGGAVNEFVHVGTNTINLDSGLEFDEMFLSYVLDLAVKSCALGEDPCEGVGSSINTQLTGLLPIFGAPERNQFFPGISYIETAPVPLPAAAWLLLSGLGGLGFLRKRKAA